MGFFEGFAEGFFETAGSNIRKEREAKQRMDEKRAEYMMKRTFEQETLESQQKWRENRGQQLFKDDAEGLEMWSGGMTYKEIVDARNEKAELAAKVAGEGYFGKSQGTTVNVNPSSVIPDQVPTDPFTQLENEVDSYEEPIKEEVVGQGDFDYDLSKAISPEQAMAEGQDALSAYYTKAESGKALPVIIPSKPSINDIQKGHAAYGQLLLEIADVKTAAERSLGTYAAGKGLVSQVKEGVMDVATLGNAGEDEFLRQRGSDVSKINSVFNAGVQLFNAGDKRVSDQDAKRLKTSIPLISGKQDEFTMSKSKTLGQLDLLEELAMKRYMQTGKVLAQNNLAADFLNISKKITGKDSKSTEDLSPVKVPDEIPDTMSDTLPSELPAQSRQQADPTDVKSVVSNIMQNPDLPPQQKYFSALEKLRGEVPGATDDQIKQMLKTLLGKQ